MSLLIKRFFFNLLWFLSFCCIIIIIMFIKKPLYTPFSLAIIFDPLVWLKALKISYMHQSLSLEFAITFCKALNDNNKKKITLFKRLKLISIFCYKY